MSAIKVALFTFPVALSVAILLTVITLGLWRDGGFKEPVVGLVLTFYAGIAWGVLGALWYIVQRRRHGNEENGNNGKVQ